jgi:hypothetical protein
MKNLPNELNRYRVKNFSTMLANCRLFSHFVFKSQPMKDNRYRCVVLYPRPQTLPIITLPKRKNKSGINPVGDQQGNATVPADSRVAGPGKG